MTETSQVTDAAPAVRSFFGVDTTICESVCEMIVAGRPQNVTRVVATDVPKLPPSTVTCSPPAGDPVFGDTDETKTRLFGSIPK